MSDEEVDATNLNTDELLRLMEAEENEGAEWLSPREYGKLRGIAPQLVYHHIRVGHIKKFACKCGRPVIDVKEADDFFAEAKRKKDEKK